MFFTAHTISQDKLRKSLEAHEPIQLVNVLEPQHYRLGMIPGSLRIPLSQLRTRAHELSKDREVIVYCASRECDASHKAMELLNELGFTVRAYEGGIKEWTDAGLATDHNTLRCETCGNTYDKAFEVVMDGKHHTFDSFECAIHALAPHCAHCDCRIVGHGVEAAGHYFCCAHCAHESGAPGAKDRVRTS